jgi:hypothetical protein
MVAPLSEWLQIMLAEIARKQAEAQQGAEEEQRRLAAPAPASELASAATTASAPKRIAAS